MKLYFGKSRKETEVKGEEEKTVLFVCVENAARSQMAEAFFRKYAPRGYMSVSGGTRPVGGEEEVQEEYPSKDQLQ